MADATLLTRTPFLMAHDAASGYLGSGHIDRWAKTQRAGLAQQLQCGARAFDARPFLKWNGELVWHHAAVAIDRPFSSSLTEITDWLHEHPTELVLLSISDCTQTIGPGLLPSSQDATASSRNRCMRSVDAALAAHNISNLRDCSVLGSLTFGMARARAALQGGGSLLAITGTPAEHDGAACSYGNYDPTIACSGFEPKRYGCWQSDATRAYPVGRMLAGLDNVTRGATRRNASFFTQAQAIWQESKASVAIGALRNSSLLLDEQRSEINALLVREVAAGRWRGLVNLFEVNDVCDHGRELAAALLKAVRPGSTAAGAAVVGS